MGKNRRAGRKHWHEDRPKMWIRCVCGCTLGEVTRPRYRDGWTRDPLWQIGGLAIMNVYNSNAGQRYEHDHFGKVHTHSFDCVYISGTAPEVAKRPTEEEQRQWVEDWDPWDDRPAPPHPDANLNPSRYVEAGVTKRPRDVKREQRRCGREHDVTGQRILDRWNELAGITEDMSDLEAMRREKEAYRAAGKNWVMVLVD